NEEGGRFDRVVALDDVALSIGQQDAGSRDLRPMQAMGVHQEAVVADRQAEMIADALVEAVAHRPAEGGGEIDAGLPQLGRRQHFHHAGSWAGRRTASGLMDGLLNPEPQGAPKRSRSGLSV